MPSSALKPTKFAIRTHGALGSELIGTEGFGDGAVVLFVELENFDSDNATPPDENKKLPYLLPAGYSANVLVNTDFLALSIIAAQIEALPQNRFELKFKVADANKLVYQAAGKMFFPRMSQQQKAGEFLIDEGTWFSSTEDNNKFTLTFTDNRLSVKFDGIMQLDAHAKPKEEPFWKHGGITVNWSSSIEYKVDLIDVDGTRRIVLSERSAYKFDLKYNWSPEMYGIFDVYLFSIENAESDYLSYFHSTFFEHYNVLKNLNLEVDTFIMSSLLFRNSQIAIDSLHQPNDFITIGQLAPKANKFIIKPSDNGEIGVLAGGKISFKTQPSLEGVTWSVRHLPDYTGDDLKGEINENTGVYTAPAANKFKGSHIKVIVTAEKGSEVSHALVSVLRTSVSVYPSIMTVNLNGYADIIAGDMNGEFVNMELEGLGELIIPMPVPLAQRTMRYQAPKDAPEWDPSMPEVDLVMRHSRVVVSSTSSEKVVDILLPVEVEGSYWLVAKAAGTGVKFEFWVRNKLGNEIQIPEDETSWHVRVGNGTIDAGVYTPDPDKAEEYAVIVAIHDTQFIPQYASMILPLPFIDVKQFLALHAPDEAKEISSQ